MFLTKSKHWKSPYTILDTLGSRQRTAVDFYRYLNSHDQTNTFGTRIVKTAPESHVLQSGVCIVHADMRIFTYMVMFV